MDGLPILAGTILRLPLEEKYNKTTYGEMCQRMFCVELNPERKILLK